MQRSYLSLRFLAVISVMLIALSGCISSGATPDDFVVADLFATPGKSLATIALSATPEPSVTLPNVPTSTPAPTLPLPSVMPLQTLPIVTFGPLATRTPRGGLPGTPIASGPVNCPSAPPMPFTPVWQNVAQAQAMMRCPVGGMTQFNGVWQTFEHGIMFWRESDKSIFVLSNIKIQQGQPTDGWWRVNDTWQEGEPESDPGLEAPGGLRQPIRGFGKVWRENGFIREAVGWATSEEIGAAIAWQQFEGGFMMTGPNNAPVYVMAPNDAPPYSSGVHLGGMP